MKIVFSDHAVLKISQRKLSRKKIQDTIAHFDFMRPSDSGREELFKRLGKNYLKVVIVREGKTTIVVTAHWVAKVPKK